MVERAQLEAFRLANNELSRMVKAELAAFFASLNLDRPEAARDALLAFVPLLVDQYGAVAGTMATEFYEEMRAASGATGRFTALAAPGVPTEAVEAKVRHAAGHLWTPEPAAMLSPLLTSTDKYVKQPARNTVAFNAKRERVRWARVPTGAKTCSFCLVMASRDAKFLSEKSAGGGDLKDKFHGECNCEAVRIGDSEDYPEGYLPDDYYSIYDTSRKLANSDDPAVRAFRESLDPNDKNKDLKTTVFAMRRNFPDLVNDGVHTH